MYSMYDVAPDPTASTEAPTVCKAILHRDTSPRGGNTASRTTISQAWKKVIFDLKSKDLVL